MGKFCNTWFIITLTQSVLVRNSHISILDYIILMICACILLQYVWYPVTTTYGCVLFYYKYTSIAIQNYNEECTV